ncbi:hypothetical protein [Microbacterium sp. NPDC058345]|uniref:hypothetical protein n=1 Tax=Microbacterium sp. NPDC058345 TaxID=3346455 RepID=UPI00364F03B7
MAASAAMMISLMIAAPSSAAQGAVPVVANPDFASVASSGLPEMWRAWNPAGTAEVTVDQTAGPDGGSAVSITATTGAATRYALTQRIAVDETTPRELVVSASVKGIGLSGGFSEVRVQAFDAAGKAIVPVQKGPYLTGTFDWKTVSTEITLPAGAAQLSIEPMLDRSPGTLWVTGVRVDAGASTASLTATATAHGVVELFWSFDDAQQAARYAVHRTTGAEPPARDDTSFLRSAYAATTADDGVSPDTTYTYQVDAVAADGTVIATTPARQVTTPAVLRSTQQNTIVTALEDGAGARVSWTLAEHVPSEDLSLRAGRRTVDVAGAQGHAQIAAHGGQTVELRSGATVIGTAVVGSSEHPRAIATGDAISTVKRALAKGQPTVTGAWSALLSRVSGPDSGYASNGSAGLYRARDAAFAYAVTGDPSYAQTAYDGIMASLDFIVPRDVNMGLELARAQLLLAPAYDWAHAAWTEAQRATVRTAMTRSVDLLSTYHHPALDDTSKTSNWVGVVRASELALLLAARGDGDFGYHDARIGMLADQVAQHLDQAYTDSGYTQEGWDYFHYTALYMLPSIYLAQGTGMTALDEHLQRPQFWNLALHVASYRQKGDVAQWGVSGPNGQVAGAFPLLFPITPKSAVDGMTAVYDEVMGVDSATRSFDGIQGLWSMLYYPTHPSASTGRLTAKAAKTAILDDVSGFYAFRNRYRDSDDTIIVTSNRNQQHRGWSSSETFSLSWIGDDTTWATLGGKAKDAPALWSVPLIDGELQPYASQYETVNGKGRTLDSRAFRGQGGGYLHLDGSENFEVVKAERQEVVDLAKGGRSSAIVAVKDRFDDTVPHEWSWQLRPENGVSITIDDSPSPGSPMFTFTAPNGATLSGFVLEPEGLIAENIDGTLRLTRAGTHATFRIVLATSRSGPLTATMTGAGRMILDGRVIDTDRLAQTPASGLAMAH